MKKPEKLIDVPIRFGPDHKHVIEYYERIATLSGLRAEQVMSVVLAMTILSPESLRRVSELAVSRAQPAKKKK